MFESQKILPAISSHQDLRKFLKTSMPYGILMNFQLAQLPSLIEAMQHADKKILIHLDMIKGLSSDEYGAIYLIQHFKVDGVITTKPRVIDLCKKRGVIGIMRFFLKDSISLSQSLEILKRSAPDAVEVLPAKHSEIIDTIRGHTSAEILMGGLIETKEEIRSCLAAGAAAVTTSNFELWSE